MRRLRTTSTQPAPTIVAAVRRAGAHRRPSRRRRSAARTPRPSRSRSTAPCTTPLTRSPGRRRERARHVHQRPAPLRLAAERRRLPARRRAPRAGCGWPATAARGSSCSPRPATPRSSPTASASPSTTLDSRPPTRWRCRPARKSRDTRSRASRTCSAASTASRRPWTLSGAQPTIDRRPPDLHGPDRPEGRRRAARRRRARVGRASTASRCAPPSTPRARTRRCSSSRPTTSRTARSTTPRSTPGSREGTRVVEIDPPTGVDEHGRPTRVRGADAVQQRLPFELSAPAELAGLPRTEVRLIDASARPAP